MLAGASGTAHTLAQRGDERAPPTTTCFRTTRRRAPRRGLRRPRSAGGRAAAAVGRAGRRPALDPARRAAARAARASRSSRRRGRWCCSSSTAAVIALILNPLVAGLQRSHLPRGVAIVLRLPRLRRRAGAAGVAAGQPDLRPGPDAARRHPVDHRLREPAPRRRAGLLRPQGHQRRDQEAGPARRCRRCRSKVVGGTDSIVSFGDRPAHEDRHRRLRADPRLRPLGLHAHPRRADRGARARGDAAGGRHAARTTTPRASCGRSPATCAGQLLFSVVMGAGAGLGLWIFGVDRDLPRRQDLRARVRRVVRAHGADPVRRARSWAPCRRCSSRSSRTR